MKNPDALVDFAFVAALADKIYDTFMISRHAHECSGHVI